MVEVTKSGGVYFNGINSYGEIINSSIIEFNELSIYFRFYPREELREWRHYLAKGNANAFSLGWVGWRFNCDIGRRLNFDLSENNTNYVRLRATDIINNWYDVLAWWDGKTAELWVNGSLVASSAFSGNINNTLPIIIGAQSLLGNNSKSIFDKLIVWNRAITDEEKEELFKGIIPDNYLVYIPFNDNSGVIASDISGNNYHCRLHNCRWIKPVRRGMHFYNGGINFASGVSVNCNYATTVAVFRIDRLAKGGTVLCGRNCVLHVGGDKLMLFNHSNDKCIMTTNFDGTVWYECKVCGLENGKIYTAAGIQNGNEEHIYLLSGGVIIGYRHRTDLGECGSYSNVDVQIGSNPFGKYYLEGDVLAAFVYNRPLSEDEIKEISINYINYDKIPKSGLVFCCILDRYKYGNVPYDIINKVYSKYIGTPRWCVKRKEVV